MGGRVGKVVVEDDERNKNNLTGWTAPNSLSSNYTKREKRSTKVTKQKQK